MQTRTNKDYCLQETTSGMARGSHITFLMHTLRFEKEGQNETLTLVLTDVRKIPNQNAGKLACPTRNGVE